MPACRDTLNDGVMTWYGKVLTKAYRDILNDRCGMLKLHVHTNPCTGVP